MPKLSNLLVEKAKADVHVGDIIVGFSFYVLWRERFTPDELAELPTTADRDYFKRLLPRVLVSWDLQADDGSDLPVTADVIEQHQVPIPLMAAIERRALFSDLEGKVPSSAPSAAG